MKRNSSFRIITVALLVTGNAVGAGILALPVKTGLAGIAPALLSMATIWGLMLLTGLIMSTRLASRPEESRDLPTFFFQEIGPWGKWLCALGYLIVFYGLLVAYLSGAASILSTLVPLPVPQRVWLLVFFAAATTITLFGIELVRKGNAAIMILLLASFLFLSLKTGQNVEIERLRYTDWRFAPALPPIIVCAFAFHNVIPVVCRSLNNERRAIGKAIVIGTLLAFLMTTSWTVIVIGAAMGYEELRELFMKKLPKDHRVYNEYHALCVQHAKEFCGKVPLCSRCPVSRSCSYGST